MEGGDGLDGVVGDCQGLNDGSKVEADIIGQRVEHVLVDGDELGETTSTRVWAASQLPRVRGKHRVAGWPRRTYKAKLVTRLIVGFCAARARRAHESRVDHDSLTFLKLGTWWGLCDMATELMADGDVRLEHGGAWVAKLLAEVSEGQGHGVATYPRCIREDQNHICHTMQFRSGIALVPVVE